MLSQHSITCVLCLTTVLTQQHYCVGFYRAVSESDKLLAEKNSLCSKMMLRLLTQKQKAH